MYEDHTVEERYLYNFSARERELFIRQQTAYKKHMQEYQQRLYELLFSESPAKLKTTH